MTVDTVRDWVLIFAGLLWGTLTVLVLAAVAGLLFAALKGFSLSDRLLLDRLHATLEQAHVKAMALRDLTSRMPGNTPLPEGQVKPARAQGPLAALPLPWRRKRRRRLPFLK